LQAREWKSAGRDGARAHPAAGAGFSRCSSTRPDGRAMTGSTIRKGAAALALLAAGAAAPPSEPRGGAVGSIVIREQLVVHFPGLGRQSALPLVRWKEGKGPKCISWRTIAGAALPGENSVDLILRDRSRIRARLDRNCPALDYYYGFYISPNPDGMICADRDIIRSRVGGQCPIDRFRRLKAKRAD
jgi:hypothetical protein